MKHKISNNGLEGFECSSILASHSGNKDNQAKKLIIVSKINPDMTISTKLEIHGKNGIHASTACLDRVIRLYNEL